ncbi:MAG TPA: alpha/beta fold hydrolase [Labilithrix sp.]|nr:alpha/beta fold hydrolase [Labilithrix sp.]
MILYGRTLEQTIDRHERAAFVKEIVVTSGRVPLAMVRKRLDSNGGGCRAPVLLVHGFGQNRYAWHLPARSFANYLAREGYDVFNLDLRGHGRSLHFGARTSRHIDDYVSEDLPIAVDEILSHTGGRPPFVVGHSLGGLVSYAAAPRLSGAVAGVASIGSPYHFARGSLSLKAIATFVDALRRIGVPSVGLPVPLRPVGALIRTLRSVAESPFYPLPLRGWHAGALEPHVLDQHLRLAFDRAGVHELRNMCEWATQKRFGGPSYDYVERFEAMDLPLLVIAGINDDLAPPASVRPAFVRSRSLDKTYRSIPLGHIDLLVGRDAPLSTWPLVSSWIEARCAA